MTKATIKAARNRKANRVTSAVRRTRRIAAALTVGGK